MNTKQSLKVTNGSTAPLDPLQTLQEGLSLVQLVQCPELQWLWELEQLQSTPARIAADFNTTVEIVYEMMKVWVLARLAEQVHLFILLVDVLIWTITLMWIHNISRVINYYYLPIAQLGDSIKFLKAVLLSISIIVHFAYDKKVFISTRNYKKKEYHENFF